MLLSHVEGRCFADQHIVFEDLEGSIRQAFQYIALIYSAWDISVIMEDVGTNQ